MRNISHFISITGVISEKMYINIDITKTEEKETNSKKPLNFISIVFIVGISSLRINLSLLNQPCFLSKIIPVL